MPGSCPSCGHSDAKVLATGVKDFEYGAPGEFTWLICAACELVRLDPLPTPALLDLAYPPHYHAFVQPSSGLTRWLIARSRRGLGARLASLIPRGGSMLDVGCSTGDLLAEVGSHGEFMLNGVEMNEAAAVHARARGIRVFSVPIEAAEVPPGSMDLVTLQHVVEHVVDPIALLRKVFLTLRPSGRVMGELPNLASLDGWLFGRYWGGGHAPRHIWHFTPRTLRRALEACGFTDVVLRPALHTGHWALSLQNLLRRRRTSTADLRSGRAWYYPALLLATVPVNVLQMCCMATGVMRFEARRPDP